MAKVTAPLLSFTASGKLANTIVAFTWKGISVMRKYVVPANPQTADQTTQRGYVTSCVSAWKNYFTAALGRAAWNRWALNAPSPMSGFNGFMSQALKLIGADPDGSWCNTAAAIAGNLVEFTVLNLDDGTAGDEAGNFEIWVGDTVSGMTLSESVAIAASKVTGTTDLGDAGDVKYCKIRKDSYDRSGLFKLTLID